MIVGEGTQHSPGSGFSTLMVTGDMKAMSPEFLRAATMTGYGVSMYIGLGIPIPVLDVETVRATAVKDEDIFVDIVDYGIPSRSRPTLKSVSYAELKSGFVELAGEEVRTSSLSSFRKAREVALAVKSWVEEEKIFICMPTRPINHQKKAMPLRETVQGPRVLDIMDRGVISIRQDEEIRAAAKKLLRGETNHLPVIGEAGELVGIVTTYDISKAVANPGKASLVKDIMKKKVITTTPEEAVDIAVRKLEKNNISALPVIDTGNHVIGMLTAMNLGKLFGRWLK
jgi:CBS domain-containing protein